MATQTQKVAFNAIRAFRQREMNNLERHLRKFGPLPELPESVLANAPADAPPPFALPNPFLPNKHPQMRKWVRPKYSLRRQAELVKKAQACGELHLLPDGPKKFAAELRAERVKKSLSLSVLDQLAEMDRQASASSKYASKAEEERATSEERVKDIESRIKEYTSTLNGLEKNWTKAKADFDVAELAAFDAEADDSLSKDQISKIVSKVETLKKIQEEIREEMVEVEELLNKAQNELNSVAPSAEVHDWAWKAQVHWVPEFKPQEAPGTELGTRLYTGKKRMFKGHLWERLRAGKLRKHAILMRDMAARIARYKNYYKKRKPNPLKPSRYTKPPKLPY